jgi:hypothetical protein
LMGIVGVCVSVGAILVIARMRLTGAIRANTRFAPTMGCHVCGLAKTIGLAWGRSLLPGERGFPSPLMGEDEACPGLDPGERVKPHGRPYGQT